MIKLCEHCTTKSVTLIIRREKIKSKLKIERKKQYRKKTTWELWHNKNVIE